MSFLVLLLALIFAFPAAAQERRNLDELLVLPPAVAPGEEIHVEIRDPKGVPAGSIWMIAGIQAAEHEGHLRVKLPSSLKAGGRIAISLRDTAGRRLVNESSVKGVRIVDRPAISEPRLTGCTKYGIIGETMCVCGEYTPESWRGLQIDGKPAGPPVAASSRVVVIRLPADLAPGAHVISGDPELGFSPSSQVVFQALEIGGQIDRAALLRGERTAVRLQVKGALESLPIRIANHDPKVVRIQGGNEQTVHTSGGDLNIVERRIDARRRGDFRLTYQLQMDACACAAQEPRRDDSRGFVAGRVLAVVPLAAAQAMTASAQALAAANGLTVVEIAPLATTNEALIVFSIRDAVDVLIKVAALSADPRVIFAQPDYLFETRAGQVAYARGLMHVDQLHPSVTGNGISVTVIDSGVDASITADRADFTGTGMTSDLHGTLMAGMIRETAPRAGILAYKACVPVSPQSMQARCAATALSKALDKAVQRRSQVINMSVAGPKERLVTRLVEAAVASGAVVLAAVGNLGPKGDAGYPAALDNVIAVTAVDAREEVYRYATPGPFTDIAAPGVEVLGQIPGKQQVFVSGTSAATAYSSGVAALLLQQKPGISPAALQSLLEGSAKELGATGKDIHFGSGLIDVCRATSCR